MVRDRLGTLSATERAGLADEMSIDCERLARAGILAIEPSATEASVRYIVAERRYGADLAKAAFGTGTW